MREGVAQKAPKEEPRMRSSYLPKQDRPPSVSAVAREAKKTIEHRNTREGVATDTTSRSVRDKWCGALMVVGKRRCEIVSMRVEIALRRMYISAGNPSSTSPSP